MTYFSVGSSLIGESALKDNVSLGTSSQRKSIIGGTVSVLILLVVLIACGRYLFGGDKVRVDTLLPSILDTFSSESFASDLIMNALKNFSSIKTWTQSSSDILQGIKTIVSFFGYIGNFVYLFFACLVNAFKLIMLIFSLIFIPVG